MANIKSQIKRNRQNETRRVRNRSVRSELHTRARQAVEAAEAGDENAEELATQAIKRIDGAVAKGVLHKNAGARKKSRLVRQLASISAD